MVVYSNNWVELENVVFVVDVLNVVVENTTNMTFMTRFLIYGHILTKILQKY